MNNIGGLFKYLNSEECALFFQDLTTDNKDAVLENMMGNEEFMTTATELVGNENIIRDKLCVKLMTVLKKKSVPVAVVPVTVNEPANTVVTIEDLPVVIDEKLGTHIGNGIYLLREDHLIKMTTPDWVVYY